ncbi:caspase family protein [Methylobacterium oryzihabitans]|uniref:Caspase family protein n=1 Tax=Methylobacterium oryzihabitans TaxID=2499852 RepID=A0A3S2WBJ4_9HYPH|nr:caspase family protein [Methylobacterium oryzihabitans]RVU18473.1 caspase family protein [Methylobacterium oryzihabitans]
MAVSTANRFSETIHAVVVGISAYDGSGLTDLPDCAPEAAELASALSASRMCGVPASQVHLIPDPQASRTAILGTLAQVAAQARASDIVIFYFAGHGEASDQGFILRTGPRLADPALGLSREDVAGALKGTAARGILVILDCCGGAGFAENAPDLFNLATHDFRLLVSASRAGESSWELPDRGSLFTRRLLSILRGETVLDRTGGIFFNDLFDDLKTTVVDEARRQLPPGQTQTPVFAGTHAGDPLLFLNRDLTLEQVRVRTVRVTRQTLRRRVLATAAGLVGGGGLALLLYWAFLDSHHYLDLTDNRVSLVHGYPGLTGFGLPRTEWIYGEEPSDLAESALAPREGRPLVLSREASPEAALLTVLRPPGRARLRIWAGDRAGARRDLLAAAQERRPSAANDLEFLPETVVAEDADELDRIVRASRPEESVEPVLALAALDPSRAVAAWRASPASRGGGGLTLLSSWQGPCTAAVQDWLDAALSDGTDRITYLTAVRAIVRTKGCRLDPAKAFAARQPSDIRDVLFALRMSNSAGAEAMRTTLAAMLGPPDALARSAQVHGERLAGFWRYSGGAACGAWLLDPSRGLPEEARIDAAVAAVRDCPGARLDATVADGRLRLALRQGDTATAIAAYPLDGSPGARVLKGVDALVEARAEGRDSALRAILGASRSSETRRIVAKALLAVGADGSEALAYALPASPPLDRELLRWLSRIDQRRASAACAERILAGQVESPLIEALALIPMETIDRERLLAFAATQDLLPRTIISVLLGSADEATALLLAPQPEVRTHAQSYALARTDAIAVFAAARRRSVRADAGLERGASRLRRLAAIEAELATTPDFALEWRAGGIDTFESADAGLSLAIEQILERRRGRRLPDTGASTRKAAP